jgi:hypothetical protein
VARAAQAGHAGAAGPGRWCGGTAPWFTHQRRIAGWRRRFWRRRRPADHPARRDQDAATNRRGPCHKHIARICPRQLGLCVCMYVCMYLCMYVCVYICLCVAGAYARMRDCVYVCLFVCVCVRRGRPAALPTPLIVRSPSLSLSLCVVRQAVSGSALTRRIGRVTRQVYAAEGVPGLFRGWLPRIIVRAGAHLTHTQAQTDTDRQSHTHTHTHTHCLSISVSLSSVGVCSHACACQWTLPQSAITFVVYEGILSFLLLTFPPDAAAAAAP